MNGLLEKYNDYVKLIEYKVEYELDDGTIIKAKYKRDGFAHLIGLHKLKDLQLIQFWQDSNNKAFNAKEIARRIKNETFTEADVMSSRFYSIIQGRYKNFSYDNLTTLNYTDAIVDFNATIINSKIKSNYILFEEKPLGEFNHMGIVYRLATGEEYIETFFHEPTDSYIAGQNVVKVKKIRLIDSRGNVVVEDSF